MTKISNQYSLTNILTADLANSRLGINNVSPAYSLDVTGTGRFSGSVGIGKTPRTGFGINLDVSGGIQLTNDSANISYLAFGQNSNPQLSYTYIGGDARSTGFMNFFTNDTERMRIISTGNILVNTTTNYALGNDNNKGIIINTNSGGFASFISFRNNNVSKGLAYANDVEMILFAQANIPMIFGTNDTERMRITSGGQVCIGTTTAGVQNTPLCLVNSTQTARIWSTGPNTSGDYVVYSNSGGGISGVYVGYGATSWTGASDIRLKNIIEPIDNAVDKLLTLNPIVFSWKHDSENKENLGLIAQDVQKVFPQIVDTQNDEIKTKGVRYTELIPVLVKAIQELSAKVSLLENK